MRPTSRRAAAPTRDLERDVTVVVKTFERPTCIRRLLASIRRFYPGIGVVVVDDSEVALDLPPDANVRYFHLPYNSLGAAGGRNFGLRQVDTEFVAFCDDDVVFKRKTDLRTLVGVLRTTPFGVATGRWVEYETGTWIRQGVIGWEGTLEIADGVLVHHRRASRGQVDGLPVFDVLPQNFFVARRADLGEDPWDATLNLAEHTDFFLTLKERGVLCTLVPEVAFYHYPERPPRYDAVREDTRVFHERLYAKRGFGRKEFVGDTYPRRDQIIQHYPSVAWYHARRFGRVAQRLLREGRLRAPPASADVSS